MVIGARLSALLFDPTGSVAQGESTRLDVSVSRQSGLHLIARDTTQHLVNTTWHHPFVVLLQDDNCCFFVGSSLVRYGVFYWGIAPSNKLEGERGQTRAWRLTNVLVIYTRVRARAHTHTYTHTRGRPRARARTHTHTHTHTSVFVFTQFLSFLSPSPLSFRGECGGREGGGERWWW